MTTKKILKRKIRTNKKMNKVKRNKTKKHITVKKNKKHTYNIKNNNTLMIDGLKHIINCIIKTKINENILINYCNCFIKNTNTIKGISNPRISKIPYTKWYTQFLMKFTPSKIFLFYTKKI